MNAKDLRTKGNNLIKENNIEGIKYLEQAANLKDHNAYIDLGNLYYNGKIVEKNIDQAITYYQKALAITPNHAGYYNLAICYQYHKKDYPKAIDYYQKDIELFKSKNQSPEKTVNQIANLGYKLVYTNKTDLQTGAKALLIAATNNHINSMNNVGVCYKKGYGFYKDIKKAKQWFQKAADLNNAYGADNLGEIYKEEGDYLNAYEYYKKAFELGKNDALNHMSSLGHQLVFKDKTQLELGASILLYAANSGNSSAMNNIGICYQKGYGVDINLEKAMEWYQKGMKINNVYAIENLGLLYKTQKDYPNAYQYLKKACEKKKESAFSSLASLGHQLVFKDQTELELGFQILLDAATYNVSEAMNNVAICYEKGYGTSKDINEAIKWYQKAVEKKNNKYAANNLGIVYEFNKDIENDLAKAIHYYEIGAKLGNEKSIKRLEKYYRDKNQVSQFYNYIQDDNDGELLYQKGLHASNDSNSFNYYLKAALKNHPLGIAKVAYYYICGIGTDQNISKGKEYYGRITTDEARYQFASDCLESKVHSAHEYGLSVLEKLGTPEAKRLIGICHLFGKGVTNDVPLAYEYFKQAYASKELGKIYYHGIKNQIDIDYTKAINYFKEQEDDVESNFYLGLCAYLGNGLPKDPIIAMQYFNKAYRENYPLANVMMGIILMNYLIPRKEACKYEHFYYYINQSIYDYPILRKLKEGDCFNNDEITKEFINTYINSIYNHKFTKNEKYNQSRYYFAKHKVNILAEQMQESEFDLQKEMNELQEMMESVVDITYQTNDTVSESNQIIKTMSEKLNSFILNFNQQLQKQRDSYKEATLTLEQTKEFMMNNSKTINQQLTINDKEFHHHEQSLRNLFGNSYDKLLPDSKRSLVSARILMHAIEDMNYPDFDYSGICISALTALENEVTNLIIGYQDYLETTIGDPSEVQWPKDLVNGNKRKEERHITLGTLEYILTNKNRNQFHLDDYLATITNGSLATFRELNIVNDCKYVTSHYRNLLSHKNPVGKDIALEAYQSVVEKIEAYQLTTQITGLLVKIMALKK